MYKLVEVEFIILSHFVIRRIQGKEIIFKNDFRFRKKNYIYIYTTLLVKEK